MFTAPLLRFRKTFTTLEPFAVMEPLFSDRVIAGSDGLVIDQFNVEFPVF